MSDLDPRLFASCFIAGTDTGVGKTWVARRLLRAWVSAGRRVAGMKPVAAGAEPGREGGRTVWRNEDALALRAAGNVEMPYEWINPVCLPRATSPHIAAREAGVKVDIESIVRNFGHIVTNTELIAVEGAGGWHAPIGEPATPGEAGPTMADVALRLGLPVLLVVGLRLGCLNHALLTQQAIEKSGAKLAGWIANPIDSGFADGEECARALEIRLRAPRLRLPPDFKYPRSMAAG